MLELDLIRICAKTHSGPHIFYSPRVRCFDTREPHLFLFQSEAKKKERKKKNMTDLSCRPSLRLTKSSVLHVQIPQQTGLECHPGLSCSKELRGQTCQVNLPQSDRVYPPNSPPSL